MASSIIQKINLTTILVVAILGIFVPEGVTAQNCGCATNFCCSKWGYCGTGDAYCGEGCQEGPCYAQTPPSSCNCAADLCCSQWGYCGTGQDFCGTGCQAGPCFPPPTPNNVSIAQIITKDFFDAIINVAGPSCPGKGFYSRESFLEASNHYPLFGRLGSVDDSKRELAAYFAHVTHETGHFCYIEEINGNLHNYCDATNAQWPCVPGKNYFGRGPIQLSWNFNYGPAGKEIGFDGLSFPETVATNPLISFRTSMWYWVQFVQPVMNQGFGATIRAINGALECNGGNPATVQARVQYYTNYCSKLGVDPGSNLYC